MTAQSDHPVDMIAPPADLTEAPVMDVLRRVGLDGDGPLTQQVYGLFRRLIVSLHLMPNQLLPEKEVAQCLGVSKTPVREAFIRLSEENLVEIVPKIGTYVAPIDLRRAFNGYFIRTALESSCAERLAGERNKDAIARLRVQLEAQKRSVELGDNDGFYVLDNDFHMLLFDVAGVSSARRLVDVAKSEVDRIKGLKSIYRFCLPEEELYQQHKYMVDVIEQGDVKAARESIYRHLSGMNEAIEAILKEEKLWGMFNSLNNAGRGGR